MQLMKKRLSLVLLVVATVLLVSGCSGVADLSYETTADHDALAALHGGKLALIRFDADGVLLRAEPIDEDIAEAIGDEHKAAFIEEMAAHFDIVDLTDEDITDATVDDPARIRAILDEIDADGAVIVRNGYGYELTQGGPIVDEAAEDVAEDTLGSIFGKKAGDWLQSLTGPTVVTFYYLASDTAIVDEQGEVVWQFYGKAAGRPGLLSGSAGEEAETFVRSFAGGNPTQNELSRAIRGLYAPYSAYLSWMLEQELEESENLNYFTDYPSDVKRNRLAIYPADDSLHTPTIMTEAERADYEERQRNSLWAVARSSRWRIFWQWPQAWAALKILGVALVVVVVVSFLMDRGQNTSDEPGCIQIVGFVASVALLASLYFLLRAIF